MAFSVTRLQPEDGRSTFQSGNIELDRFFSRYAGQNQFRHHIGTTYVAVDERDTIVGYTTVVASELSTVRLTDSQRKRLPAYPVPVLRLARLAVDLRAQRQGVAHTMLRAVFILAERMALEVGCIGVVVDAKPEAVAFYKTLGFVALAVLSGELGDRPQPLPMFLELGAILAAGSK